MNRLDPEILKRLCKLEQAAGIHPDKPCDARHSAPSSESDCCAPAGKEYNARFYELVRAREAVEKAGDCQPSYRAFLFGDNM